MNQDQKNTILSQSTLEIIRQNIQSLNQSNKNSTVSNRNLLNKWFLDSIKNYFMEQHAAPLIMAELGVSSSQEVKSKISQSADESIPKYMSILANYVQNLIKFNKIDQFKAHLIAFIEKEVSSTTSSNDYNAEKSIRKQFVSLMIITFCNVFQKIEINSFYDLWNITFPNDQQKKRRLSKYDVIKDPTSVRSKKGMKRISTSSKSSSESSGHSSSSNKSKVNNKQITQIICSSNVEAISVTQITSENSISLCRQKEEEEEINIDNQIDQSNYPEFDSLSVNPSPVNLESLDFEFFYSSSIDQITQDIDFEQQPQSNQMPCQTNFNEICLSSEAPVFQFQQFQYVPLYENEQINSQLSYADQFFNYNNFQ